MDHPYKCLLSSSPTSLPFFIILIFLTTLSILASPQIEEHEIDRLTLLKIKTEMVDPTGILSLWNESSDFCKWYGITCSHRHRKVTILSLNSLNLLGTLSPHIGNLSFLRELHLQNNSFNSNIPSEVGRLFQLEKLFLNDNSFNGQIPSNLSCCSNLLILHLSNNKLEGNLPKELGSLSKLQELALEYNNFIGNIPSSFGNLSSLQAFNATFNNLFGSIPDTLGQLKKLHKLSLGGNKFGGTFPTSIFNLSSIIELDLTENELEGHLPSNLGFTHPNLKFLLLAFNHFTGQIPTSIANASNLLHVNIAYNNFTGEVPSFTDMRQLQRLRLSGNTFGIRQQGDLNFLCSLTNSTNLQILRLGDNNFGGSIPKCIGNLSVTLLQLSLIYNYIYGSLPSSIGHLINLEMLGLTGNHISGYIPPVIGNLNKLQQLYLSQNEFSGEIPQSLGDLSILTLLGLDGNHLQGSIPSSLGKLEKLIVLDLANNNLNSSIPPELIGLSSLSSYLNLSQNNLTGTIPQEVGNLKYISELVLHNNRLSGKIPSSIGQCISMEFLYLQDNFLEGPLSSTLSSLKGIRVMNFSNNRLSGQIPGFLGSLDLLNLSLSYNDFEGPLPIEGVFKNVNSASVVGNKKLCGGLPEFHLPKCKFTEPHVTRRSQTTKIVIICTLFALISALFLYYFFWSRHNKKSTSSSTPENGRLEVSYHDLLKATNGFSSANLLGTGSFGMVYKGFLNQTGTIVAIKILNLTRHGAFKSFKAECEVLRKIRHRNLLKVLTACSGIDFSRNDFKALVYEFMVGGSLDEWLHPIALEDKTQRALNLLERVSIALDVACALDYLHHHCETPIIHCDIKPSNVLLDSELVAHVSDFGLAKFLPEAINKSLMDQTSSIGIKGSFGYIAPEYGSGSKASTRGDIYSYGVLILEIFTGKRPTDAMFQDGLNLHAFAKAALANQVEKILDPFLLQEVKEFQFDKNISSTNKRNLEESMVSIIEIGVVCSSESPLARMDITNVLIKLQGIKEKLL